MLQVRWDPPLHPVQGYDILYRKFEWVYSGRWHLKEISDPTALASEIIVNKPENSFIVVVQGKPVRGRPPHFQQPNFGGPMGNNNMGQPSMNRGQGGPGRSMNPGPGGNQMNPGPRGNQMMGGQNPFRNNNMEMQGNQPQGQSLSVSSMSNPGMPQQQQMQGGFGGQRFRP